MAVRRLTLIYRNLIVAQKTLYLDLDGVLADFTKRYIELYDEHPDETRGRKNFSKNWAHFIEDRNFATLDKFPGCDTLLYYVSELEKNRGINVQILSSSGGEQFHHMVEAQKKLWLISNGLFYKRNIVSSRKLKKNYATPHSILIDDTEDVIADFNEAGGIGILHKNVADTIKTLNVIFEKH